MTRLYDLVLCVADALFRVFLFFKRAWDVLLLVVLLIFLGFFYWDKIHALNEAHPTSYSMQRFPESYDGEYWLQLTGQLALEHRHIKTQKGPRNEETLVVYVPFVSQEWDVRQPVHAIAVFERIRPSELRSWLQGYQASRVHTITGMVDRAGSFSSRFPNLEEGSPCVFVREGDKPWRVGDLASLTAVLLL